MPGTAVSRRKSRRGPFFYAEPHHQQYLAKVPDGYCGLGGTGVSCPMPTGVSAAWSGRERTAGQCSRPRAQHPRRALLPRPGVRRGPRSPARGQPPGALAGYLRIGEQAPLDRGGGSCNAGVVLSVSARAAPGTRRVSVSVPTTSTRAFVRGVVAFDVTPRRGQVAQIQARLRVACVGCAAQACECDGVGDAVPLQAADCIAVGRIVPSGGRGVGEQGIGGCSVGFVEARSAMSAPRSPRIRLFEVLDRDRDRRVPEPQRETQIREAEARIGGEGELSIASRVRAEPPDAPSRA